jgi:predicted small secreted protein
LAGVEKNNMKAECRKRVEKMKRNIFVSVTILFVLLLVTACQTNKNVGDEIEMNLNTIIKNEKIMNASNPNEYIQQNQKAYNEIINYGNDGLNYLTKELKNSDQNGLREWIMAKACEDLLKNENPVKEWSTGKEWISKYEKSI